jgi:hypothetical protein
LYADILRALQIQGRNGQEQRLAKAETKLEFVHHFHCIVLQTRAMWPLKMKGLRPVFVFDNPRFHNLTLADLKKVGLTWQDIKRPPPYSGDFMQPIEHAHGYTACAYRKAKFRAQVVGYTANAEVKRMRKCFFDAVKGDTMNRECLNVKVLVGTIAKSGRGGYVQRRLT